MGWPPGRAKAEGGGGKDGWESTRSGGGLVVGKTRGESGRDVGMCKCVRRACPGFERRGCRRKGCGRTGWNPMDGLGRDLGLAVLCHPLRKVEDVGWDGWGKRWRQGWATVWWLLLFFFFFFFFFFLFPPLRSRFCPWSSNVERLWVS
ncbi:hypothetical protein IE53DRAFT_68616 [Violaceomyces palustris]|uniref:Uncharacterized protein n=1 Tax=Violaceomyces palustris TaxID=1673888 RepID=A0ACD0NZA8_9BASI|nr:hypothetical protein IE53DRAFT_68616 [Violaceomyces palustris]